jgi:hypothetical protein
MKTPPISIVLEFENRKKMREYRSERKTIVNRICLLNCSPDAAENENIFFNTIENVNVT